MEVPIPCLACRKNMSATALVCPHCGARQADRAWMEPPEPPAPAPARDTTPEEAAEAIDAVESVAVLQIQIQSADVLDLEDEPRGPLALVLPRPGARGRARALEWTLAVLAAPFLFAALALAVARMRLFGYALMSASETALTLVVGGLGALGIGLVAALAGWSAATTLGVLGCSGGALFARWWLRRR